ncbi:MAG: 23S rRNA (adenine(2503)-C(2))-methyltransferase RlmN [Pirellulales bacterium]|nr:23S rRNA (adenine(2503)-C(2))-methyltransferase RlmN [Pirellulales bacterium]
MNDEPPPKAIDLPALLDQSPDDFRAWLAAQGAPGYRAGQVWRWAIQKRAESFEAMSDLPGALREELARAFRLRTARIDARHESPDGTEKLLLRLADDERVECVLLRDDRHHRTVCLSTQVGCAMGCVFCASGLDGVVRNLTSGEILEQVLALASLLGENERLSHVVVMGMGEPLANLDALLAALERITAEDGLGISGRRVTISTVGLPEPIRRLAQSGRPYNLAVSLHAPTDALRNELVPANRKIGLAAILAATDEYFGATGRRVTFEYVLLDAVNDRPEHARELVSLLRGRAALVNLIPFNAVEGLPYRPPASGQTARFAETLTASGLAVKIRYRKGDRIDAACGQLRRRLGPS